MFKSSQKGLSLYLTISVMAVVLAVVLGLGTILIRQLKIIKGVENSVIAFYAADTGIERVLKKIYHDSSPQSNGAVYYGFFDIDGDGQTGSECPDNLSSYPNDACYKVEIHPTGTGGCNASFYCLKSVGYYKTTRRAIEIEI